MTATEHAGCMFTSEFALTEIVYHRAATERRPGMVVNVIFAPSGHYYRVGWGDGCETSHYAAELTREYVPDFTG